MTDITKVETFTKEYDIEVEWDITFRCNYSCSYCASYNNNNPLKLKSLEEYCKAVDYLISYFPDKIIKINILGGEPTLFKHWVLLLEYIESKGHVPTITTNLSTPIATLNKKIYNTKLKECVNTSFHPEFADENDFVAKAILLRNTGLLKSIGILALPSHWDIAIRVLNRLKHIPTCGLCVIKNEDTSSTAIADSVISYTDAQLGIINDNTISNAQTRVTRVTRGNTVTEYSSTDAMLSAKEYNFKGMLCNVGVTRIHIKDTGDCYPSACLLNNRKACMGNIYKQDLRKIAKAIVCPFTFCGCGPDLRITKYRAQ